MLILEGLDRTGKTTLAKKLVEKTGYTYSHLGVPPDNCDFFTFYTDLSGVCVIQDRHFISELVYHEIMRNGQPRIPFLNYQLVCRDLNTYAPLMTVILTTPRIVTHRILDEGESYLTTDIPLTYKAVFDRVQRLYDKFLFWKNKLVSSGDLSIQYIHCSDKSCNWQTELPWPNFQSILGSYQRLIAITVRSALGSLLNSAISSYGSLTPDLLVIGDENCCQNGETRPYWTLTGHSATCNLMLRLAGLRERTMHFVDRKQIDEDAYVTDFIEWLSSLKPSTILVLGNVVSGLANKLRLYERMTGRKITVLEFNSPNSVFGFSYPEIDKHARQLRRLFLGTSVSLSDPSNDPMFWHLPMSPPYSINP